MSTQCSPMQNEDVEDGEILESDDDSNGQFPVTPACTPQKEDLPHINVSIPTLPTEQDLFRSRRKEKNHYSTDEESASEEESDEDSPIKKRIDIQRTHTGFINPLSKSGVDKASNPWLKQAAEECNGNRRKRNNIWGSVLTEDSLVADISGLKNKDEDIDFSKKDMGVENYDYTRREHDTRPYREDNDEEVAHAETEKDITVKESFGTVDEQPEDGDGSDSESSDQSSDMEAQSSQNNVHSRLGRKHVKNRLGECMDTDRAPVKGRLGEKKKVKDRLDLNSMDTGGNLSDDDKKPRHRNDRSDRKRNRKNDQRPSKRNYGKNKNPDLEHKEMIHMEFLESDPMEQIIQDCMDSLHEKDEKRDTFERMYDTLGAAKLVKLMRATEDVERAGGIQTMDGKRRRTAGGVFFFLIRHDSEITKEMHDSIFSEQRQAWREQCKQKKKDNKKYRKEKERQLKERIAAESQMDGIENQSTSGKTTTKDNEKMAPSDAADERVKSSAEPYYDDFLDEGTADIELL